MSRPADVPYIVESRIGKGRVFYVTALNVVGSDAQRRGPEPFLYANTLYHFLHSLEQHIGDEIDFVPWTSLEHIYNRRSDGTLVLLVMNHGDMPYRREAFLANGDGFCKGRVIAKGTWRGWLRGGRIGFKRQGETLAWSFDLPPRSFILFVPSC